MVWIVRVECEVDEFLATVWMVVGDGGGSEVAGYADWVAV